MSKKKFKRVFLALDTNNIKSAENLVKLLKNDLAGLKIGKELFSYYGPNIIKKFKKYKKIYKKNGFDGIYYYFLNKNIKKTGLNNFIDKKKNTLGKIISNETEAKTYLIFCCFWAADLL